MGADPANSLSQIVQVIKRNFEALDELIAKEQGVAQSTQQATEAAEEATAAKGKQLRALREVADAEARDQQLATSAREANTQYSRALEEQIAIRGRQVAIDRLHTRALIENIALEQRAAVAAAAQAAANTEAAAATTANAAANQSLAAAVREMFPTLIGLRTLIRAVTALFAIGYIITEWDRLTKAVANAASTLGGFDKYLRDIQDDAVKASNKALEAVTMTEQEFSKLMSAKTAEDYRRLQEGITAADAEAALERVSQRRAELTQLIADYGRMGELQTKNYQDISRVSKEEAQAGKANIKRIQEINKELGNWKDGIDGVRKEAERLQERETELGELVHKNLLRQREDQLRVGEQQQNLTTTEEYDYWAKQRKEAEAYAKKLEEVNATITRNQMAIQRDAAWMLEQQHKDSEDYLKKQAKSLEEALNMQRKLLLERAAEVRKYYEETERTIEKFNKMQEREQVILERMEGPFTAHVRQIHATILAIRERTQVIEREVREELAKQKALVKTSQDLENYRRAEEAAAKAIAEAKKAQRQAEIDAGVAAAAGFAGLIGGRKAQAAVEGAFDAAKAIEMWARFAASWGTDVGAGLAAAEYTLAAAEMFKVAGTGGRGERGGGGGGGQGSPVIGGGGGGGGGGRGPGELWAPGGPLSPGASPTIQLHFYGPVVGGKQGAAELGQLLSGIISSGVNAGNIRLTASTVQTTPVPRS